MSKLFWVAVAFLVAVTSAGAIFHTPKPTNQIGVKKGDWAKYDASFSQEMKHYNDPNTNDFENNLNYTTNLEILNISENNITFKQTSLRLDGSQMKQETLTANPTKPYDEPPLRIIHLFLIPTGLSTGDRIPEPLSEVDTEGNLVFLPFTQRINETVSRLASDTVLQANHIKWTRVNRGSSGDDSWTQTDERDCYYDTESGLLLEYFQVSRKFYFDVAGAVKSSYTESHSYNIRKWSVSLLHDNPNSFPLQGTLTPRIMTDKKVYRVGDTIHAEYCMVNDNEWAVKFSPLWTYSGVQGSYEGESSPVSSIVHYNWVGDIFVVRAGAAFKIDLADFPLSKVGKFSVWCGSTSIVVDVLP